jgi:hypothetical protein
MVVAATAASISGTLVLGHAINYTAEHLDFDLANSVIGIGGRGDSLSANIPNKLSGNIAPADWNGTFSYQGINYPADLNFQASVDDGVPKVEDAIANPPEAGPVRITSYSEGTLVAEQVKRNLATAPGAPEPGDLSFLFIASPYVPNGGLFARFPGFQIPGLLPVFGPAEPSVYDSTFVINEYDPYADFPAYFNPLSLANSALAIQYAHPDAYYDNIDLDALPEGSSSNTIGNTTYIFVYNSELPLFAPLRQFGSITMLTPLTEPLLDAFEPLVRLFVDMGYTDRINANPEAPTPFSFITPPAKIVEALVGVPGALAQGAANALSGGQSLNLQPLSVNAKSAPEPEAPEVGNQRMALASVAEPAAEVVAKDPVAKDPVAKDPVAKAEVKTDTVEKDEPITHPTVTSDGNKVTPTTTADGATTGNQQPVEVVPTTPTNPPAEKEDSTTTVPAAKPEAPASTTVDAHEATDAAAA